MVDKIKKMFEYIAKSPLRKPLAFISIIWTILMATVLVVAAVYGVKFEDRVYDLIEKFGLYFLAPIIGYIFSSSWEANKKVEEETKKEIREMELESEEVINRDNLDAGELCSITKKEGTDGD